MGATFYVKRNCILFFVSKTVKFSKWTQTLFKSSKIWFFNHVIILVRLFLSFFIKPYNFIDFVSSNRRSLEESDLWLWLFWTRAKNTICHFDERKIYCSKNSWFILFTSRYRNRVYENLQIFRIYKSINGQDLHRLFFSVIYL